MIDFKELPDDGILFEQLIREILVLDGFETHWTGVGPDGGRDLIIIEKLIGGLSEHQRTWLVSCKHFANSRRSVGRTEAGNISEDCRAVGAEGYILACSTQPTASLVKRLEEIQTSQKIITKYWDCIEIEKRLNKPHTFGLIHTFFPISAQLYRWRIYNAYSPAFWAANYKDYFFYMSSRDSNTYPDLRGIEAIVRVFEKVLIYKDSEQYWNSHYLRLRGVYYDDKHCTHIAYIDYIYPKDCEYEHMIGKDSLCRSLTKISDEEHSIINRPSWDLRYIAEYTAGDHFHVDHRDYYEPFMEQIKSGFPREGFLSDFYC